MAMVHHALTTVQAVRRTRYDAPWWPVSSFTMAADDLAAAPAAEEARGTFKDLSAIQEQTHALLTDVNGMVTSLRQSYHEVRRALAHARTPHRTRAKGCLLTSCPLHASCR